MIAAILAGGKGTRLSDRSRGLPKALVEVCGKPLLGHQLELLSRCGIQEACVLTGYGAEAIETFCGDGSKWGLRVKCIPESRPLGTAGAVLAALPHLGERFLVLYGDTMLNVDLRRFEAAHQESGAAATLFLHPNDHPHDSDLVELNANGRVIAIHPYPHGEGALLPNLVNAALYVAESSALRGMPVPDRALDFGKDIFPEWLREGKFLNGYVSPEYVKDAGTPERLDRVAADCASGLVEASSLARARPGVFLDRDGTINEEVSYISRPEQLRLLPGAAEAIRLIRQAGYRIAVVTNQPVVARGECSEADLARIHYRMEMELGREGAYVDGIYYCPHHPDSGFAGEVAELKVKCDCRKPGIGLLRRATQELNLDLTHSWLIGDTTTDIAAAKQAGVKSILVGAGTDRRHAVDPDRRFPDLLVAARFLASLDDSKSALSSN